MCQRVGESGIVLHVIEMCNTFQRPAKRGESCDVIHSFAVHPHVTRMFFQTFDVLLPCADGHVASIAECRARMLPSESLDCNPGEIMLWTDLAKGEFSISYINVNGIRT